MTDWREGVSVVVITFNEERNIRECLQSVAWADEVIVVDAQSSDATVDIAKEYTDNVIVRRWDGYSATKEFAVSRATRSWILWLDADERVTEELAVSIRRVISPSSAGASAYRISRRAMFLGKWIRYCGWYPGFVVRLFRNGSAHFSTSGVHEKVQAEGAPGQLQGDILHYTDDNLFHYFSKYNNYTTLAALELQKQGRRSSLVDLVARPPFQFFKMYIARLGFLDGMHGLVLSVASATYVFVKYAKLWECEQGTSD